MSEHICRFCGKAFTRERTLSSHMCEKKRRWMSKDDPESRIAFNVWVNFMKYVSPNTKKEKNNTMEAPAYHSKHHQPGDLHSTVRDRQW